MKFGNWVLIPVIEEWIICGRYQVDLHFEFRILTADDGMAEYGISLTTVLDIFKLVTDIAS